MNGCGYFARIAFFFSLAPTVVLPLPALSKCPRITSFLSLPTHPFSIQANGRSTLASGCHCATTTNGLECFSSASILNFCFFISWCQKLSRELFLLRIPGGNKTFSFLATNRSVRCVVNGLVPKAEAIIADEPPPPPAAVEGTW